MVQQSGMYTRFCLLNNQRRFFSFGIGLQFTTLDIYIFVSHRSGFSSSRPLKLTTEEGFKGLVRHVVGMLSFKGEAAYGLDTTRTQDMFCINNRYYDIVRPLYMRGSPRGPSTVVHSLSANTNKPPLLDLQLESRMLSLSKRVTQIPDRLAYKQTYPIKGHSQEGPLFSQLIGHLAS
ncbi:hypothetical protein BGY98DRAFT_315765 [Russula aff. rugulosa BPL654]|nr:hypothetical protein BGY98DRAFT_315765 [Russula aff. rugulosa BPL654]